MLTVWIIQARTDIISVWVGLIYANGVLSYDLPSWLNLPSLPSSLPNWLDSPSLLSSLPSWLHKWRWRRGWVERRLKGGLYVQTLGKSKINDTSQTLSAALSLLFWAVKRLSSAIHCWARWQHSNIENFYRALSQNSAEAIGHDRARRKPECRYTQFYVVSPFGIMKQQDFMASLFYQVPDSFHGQLILYVSTFSLFLLNTAFRVLFVEFY